MKAIACLAFFALSLGASSCRAGKSAAGFRLPDGDPDAGKVAFLELKCNTCHAVVGIGMPPPTVDPPVPVPLGGDVSAEPSDGRLVTSIIHPSHEISARPLAFVTSGTRSRMGDYSEAMTVRQMIDIVAFLHEVYVVTRQEPIAAF